MTLDLNASHLELLLLGAIRSEPGHGYAIMQELRRKSRGQLDVATGSIYPALRALEGRDLVASRWETVDGRRRRVYEITSPGREVLGEREQQWRAYVAAVSAVLRP